jgi:YD repeat-containing protein
MALSVVGLAGVTNTEIRTHNADNQITSIGATNLVYDPNGNLQDDGVYNYTYDSENRLTGVADLADLGGDPLRTSATGIADTQPNFLRL